MGDDGRELMEFSVEVETKLWEVVAVVGDVPGLGLWDPKGAHLLTQCLCPSNRWFGRVEVVGRSSVEYRYLVCQFLDPFKATAVPKELIVVRWESHRRPRRRVFAHPPPSELDLFGCYEGKTAVEEGWLTAQHEIRLQVQGHSVSFFKSRYRDRPCRIKLVPVDVRYKEVWQEDEDEENQDGAELQRNPLFPSHTASQVAVLEGSDGGKEFSDQEDVGQTCLAEAFVVFRTQTVSPEFLAFRFDFFLESPTGAGPPERVGLCHLLPASIKESICSRSLTITSLKHQPIGHFNVDYLLISPLRFPNFEAKMSKTYCRYWKKRAALDVGHRGVGCSYTKMSGVRENTIKSLRWAAEHGADFVEFDVQLSKDLIPVVYHDFHVCVTVRRKLGSTQDLSGTPTEPDSDTELYELAVKDLKLSQLQLLKFRHTCVLGAEGKEKGCEVSADWEDDIETQSFPPLALLFQHIDAHTGFNIEIKSPLQTTSGTWECEHYFERNLYVNKILEIVMKEAGHRRVVFSSFDPNICIMLKLKQNMYPVLFLTQGRSTRYSTFSDLRTTSSEMAVSFAFVNKILGVNFHSEDLLREAGPFRMAQQKGMVSFVWGDELDDQRNIDYFRELNIDGIIYDRIIEKKLENKFQVERRGKEELLRSSSRSDSSPDDPDSSSGLTFPVPS